MTEIDEGKGKGNGNGNSKGKSKSNRNDNGRFGFLRCALRSKGQRLRRGLDGGSR